MRRFIVGTDWWTDCDDAVALRVLARAHKAKQIQVDGIAINACMEHSVTSLSAFMTSEGAGEIPIGVDRGATDYGGKLTYQYRLSQMPGAYKSNEDAMAAVKLYRKILGGSREPVEVIEIGFLQVLVQLLESGPDAYSPLSGMELVKQKVNKFWLMAGRWDMEQGRENNFARTPRACVASNVFCEKCPVPVTFLGWEVGNEVITGSKLDQDDILHKVMCDHGSSNGRKSWDPMLVLMAMIGDEETAGYSTVRGRASVDAQSGLNTFIPDENGMHAYVIKKYDNDYYRKAIDELIQSTN